MSSTHSERKYHENDESQWTLLNGAVQNGWNKTSVPCHELHIVQARYLRNENTAKDTKVLRGEA